MKELFELANHYFLIGETDRAKEFERLAEEESARYRKLVSVDELKHEPMSREFVEQSLNEQAEKFIELGFHKALNLSGQEFWKQIIDLADQQPDQFVGRFDIPLVGFGQIPIAEQAEMAKLKFESHLNYFDYRSLNLRKNERTADNTYVNWINRGDLYLGKNAWEVRDSLANDEAGASIFDGIGIYVNFPELIGEHVMLPGTNISLPLENVSSLQIRNGSTVLGGHVARFSSPTVGSITRGIK